MRLLQRFSQDESGTTFEGIALSVSIIAVAFVASADMLDYMTKSHHDAQEQVATTSHPSLPAMATVAGIRSGALDETPTGSLPKLITRSVLDPCEVSH